MNDNGAGRSTAADLASLPISASVFGATTETDAAARATQRGEQLAQAIGLRLEPG